MYNKVQRLSTSYNIGERYHVNSQQSTYQANGLYKNGMLICKRKWLAQKIQSQRSIDPSTVKFSCRIPRGIEVHKRTAWSCDPCEDNCLQKVPLRMQEILDIRHYLQFEEFLQMYSKRILVNLLVLMVIENLQILLLL